MATLTAVVAHGKVMGVRDDLVVFNPRGTNYELHLVCPRYSGPVGTPVTGVIRVVARKIWTVPSGGNFISPLFGPPRIVQGMVQELNEQSMVVHAGTGIIVEFPENDSAFDLASGPITLGRMVNVTVMPGAKFELNKS